MNQDQSIRLAELIEQLPLSRASVFEVVKALGITTSKGPGPGGRGRVAYLSSADSKRVRQAVEWVHRGETRIADLAPINGTEPKILNSDSIGDDFASTTLPDAVASAVTKATLTTMSAWFDAQRLDESEAESDFPDLHQPACLSEPEAAVRFTVDLPRSLHKRLKLAALERDQPMTDLVRSALMEWIKG